LPIRPLNDLPPFRTPCVLPSHWSGEEFKIRHGRFFTAESEHASKTGTPHIIERLDFTGNSVQTVVMEESVQEFWENMEKEVGEKILVRCLGQCLSGHPDIKRERWGVFFLTAGGLFFKTFKENPGFFETLIHRKRRGEDEVKELFFCIPFHSITHADIPTPKKFPQKIFSRPDEKTSFTYDDGTGQTVEFRYTIATGQDEFFKIFSTLLP